MSISTTLSNALTGLTAASRSAQVVSTNISNATSEGYARREIYLSARTTGGDGSGVRVDGIVRVVDENLVRERRLASAAVGQATEVAEFHQRVLDSVGQPQDPFSLTARTAAFESALLAATSRPESDARLLDVLSAAQAVATKLNDVSDQLETLRENADRGISQEVDKLNASLEQVALLNAQILRARGNNQDYPALLDSRQALIDDISELVPIRQLPRENDTVALYTMTGALLVDIEPAVFEFDATTPIIADMTIESGALSGLSLNGEAITVSGQNAQVAGGRLAGLFTVRDELAPDMQANLDEIARDLVSRFEDSSLDPTLAAGDPGLFTDSGSVLDVTNVTGLAGRISINTLVDPGHGGELRRIRDGLGSTTAGPVGDAFLINAMYAKLSELTVPLGGSFTSSERSVSGFAADFVSIAGQSLTIKESDLAFHQARLTGLDQALLADGVDTDQELQKMLLIEQSYAANAKVIQTADELIQILIRL